MINTTFYILLALAMYLLLRPLIYIQGVYQATKSNKAQYFLLNKRHMESSQIEEIVSRIKRLGIKSR